MPKLIKIKGDASFRSFFRKRVNGKSDIFVSVRCCKAGISWDLRLCLTELKCIYFSAFR